MYKLTEKDFNLFKKESEKWIEHFKLDNWSIYFGWQDSKENRASCSINLSGYIATIFLSREWGKKLNNDEIKHCAKHEVVHLLLGRLSGNARARYISESDLDESEEELVRKLEKLLVEEN